MKRKKNRPRKQAAGRSVLQIKTTIDFGEDGVPLERLGEIAKLLKDRQLGAIRKADPGFVPIPFDRYVDLHMKSNPSVDRAEFVGRLRKAVDARKAGARCDCGAFIWAIGSAEAGAACFTCISRSFTSPDATEPPGLVELRECQSISRDSPKTNSLI